MGWAHIPDLGVRGGPKLHGMQGVRGSNPLSSTTQALNLVCPTLKEVVEQAGVGNESTAHAGPCPLIPSPDWPLGSHDTSGRPESC
jgi:hypothetical protein